MSPSGSRTIRNWQNVAAGHFVALGLPAFLLFLDPLWVLGGTPPKDEDLLPLLLVLLGMACVSVCAYLLFVRTSVVIAAGTVTLKNPLREVEVPLAGLSVEPHLGFPRLHLGDRRFNAWGGENAAMELRELGGVGTQSEAPVIVRWRGPSLYLVLLLAFWISYALLGARHWVSR